MLLDQIFSSMTSVFGADPFTVFVLLVIASLFLWLTKEIRLHLDKERTWQQSEIRKSLEVLSKILLEGEKYILTKNITDFYEAVYSSIPFIDHQLAKKILAEINQENKSEEQKVSKITKLVHEKTILLSSRNRIYSTSNYLIEDVEKNILRFWRVIEPSFLSFLIIFAILFLWLVSYPWESQFWIIIKPAFLIMSLMLLILIIDLIIIRKKLNISVILLVLSVISSSITVVISEKYSWIPLLLFLIFFISTIYFGIKDKKDNEVISTELS